MNIIFSTTQGHVTPKWLIRSGPNWNLSETLCLSSLPVSLMETEFRVIKKYGYIIFSIIGLWGKKISAQGQITPKWIIWSSPNLNSIELLCLSSLPASLTNILSKVTEKSYRHHFFTTKGHVTPKWLVRSGGNSNPSNSSCLSLLPVILMKIEFTVTDKKWRHYFLHYKSMGKKNLRSRANNSKVNNLIQPKCELVRAFMPVLVTCKFDKDPIKGNWEKLETSFFSPLKGT